MSKWMLIAGAVFGASSVMSGAFGAHALQAVLMGKQLDWYDTAVTYHAGHALALLACGLLNLHVSSPANIGAGQRWLVAASVCFATGILVFSGTLYAMAFTGLTRLGMITPLGGVLLICGWLNLAVAASRLRVS